jgi:hypothetical protein
VLVRGRLLAVLLVAAGACAGGCGDGQIGEDEFVARANKLCDRYATVLKTMRTPTSIAEGVQQVQIRLRLEQALRSGFDAMRAPDRMRPPVERWLALRGRRTRLFRDQLAALNRGDATGAYAVLQRNAALQSRLNAQAGAVGLTSCGI